MSCQIGMRFGQDRIRDGAEFTRVADLGQTAAIHDRTDGVTGVERLFQRLLRSLAADGVGRNQGDEVGEVLGGHPGLARIAVVLVHQTREVLRDPVRHLVGGRAQRDRVLEQPLGRPIGNQHARHAGLERELAFVAGAASAR